MEASPLNRLPPEVRIQIYEYVFTYESLTCYQGRWSARRFDRKYPLPLAREWAPLHVCKQMRNETLHLPFSLNKPVCGGPSVDPYYDWSLPPPLNDHFDSIVKTMRPEFLTDSSKLKVHLNIFPELWEEDVMSDRAWKKLITAFRALPGALGPTKLLVTLNIYFHYEDLVCVNGARQYVPFQGKIFFEISPGDPLSAAQALPLLENVMSAHLQTMARHEDHATVHCGVAASRGKLKKQVEQVANVSRRFVEVAMWSCVPKGCCRTQWCKGLELDEVFTHIRVGCERPGVCNCAAKARTLKGDDQV